MSNRKLKKSYKKLNKNNLLKGGKLSKSKKKRSSKNNKRSRRVVLKGGVGPSDEELAKHFSRIDIAKLSARGSVRKSTQKPRVDQQQLERYSALEEKAKKLYDVEMPDENYEGEDKLTKWLKENEKFVENGLMYLKSKHTSDDGVGKYIAFLKKYIIDEYFNKFKTNSQIVEPKLVKTAREIVSKLNEKLMLRTAGLTVGGGKN
jgi:hypothetical protein